MTLQSLLKRVWNKHQALGRARFYVCRDRSEIIVCAISANHDGIYFEQEVPIVLRGNFDEEVLGSAFQSAFESFSIVDRDLRSYTPDQWPGFRASELGSLSKFQKAFIPVDFGALNESGAIVRAEAPHPQSSANNGISQFSVSTTFNPKSDPREIGAKLIQLIHFAGIA